MSDSNETGLAALERLVVDNREFEELEELLGDFNLFEAIGAVRQELRHSDTLRFLLDPTAAHGLGPAFLGRFLKKALMGSADLSLGPVEIDVADLSATEVHREWRNVDILLVNREAEFVVAIENKIGTGEHSNQLARYRQTVLGEFPTYRQVFLFLTPDGARPSQDTWVPVSYALVAETLDSLLDTFHSRLGPDAATLIRHYLSMLRRYIVSDSDIARLCQRIYRTHKQALDLIFEHRPDQVARLSDAYRAVIEGSVPYGIIPDRMTKVYLDFAVDKWDRFQWQHAGTGWTKSGRVLLFEIYVGERSSSIHLIIGPGPPEIREQIFKTFVPEKPRLKNGRTSMTSTYTQVYRHKWPGADRIEDLTDDELADVIKKRWDAFLEKDFLAAREIASEIAIDE